MNLFEITFWLSAALVVYTYAGYPVLLVGLARVFQRPLRRERFTGAVSIVVAARNEEADIGRRERELHDLLDGAGLQGEIIVVSDGSTDGTAAVARAAGDRVQVLELPANVGKAAALNAGCAAAGHDILVFADVRQTWAGDALPLLLENFADPAVGAGKRVTRSCARWD